jgi:peptide-methionine (R)-S-oxide reductase
MKPTRRVFLGAGLLAGLSAGLGSLLTTTSGVTAAAAQERFDVVHSDAEWRSLLGANSYAVLRQEATERPYSSPLNAQHGAGVFACAGCARPLFSSKTKFESHTGWPSFWKPLENAVLTREDTTFGMRRTEVHCQRCGGHLGHVFDDGPKPTGLRYCMNGAAMNFTESTT